MNYDNDDEIQSDVQNGQPPQVQMDEVFCSRMRAAIEAGLENAPIGVVTTPGTGTFQQSRLPLPSPQGAMELA